MNQKIKKCLLDIQEAIRAIDFHLGEKRNFFDYQANLTVKRAVERELEIIGEAVSRLLKEDAEFPLKNARKIVDLRNLIIHAYDAIDDEMIWGVISIHIPLLAQEIEQILNF